MNSGGVQASLDLLATVPVSSKSILATIGSLAGIDPGLVDVSLNQLAFHVAVDKPKAGAANVTVSFFADASLTIRNGPFNAAMLFRMESGHDRPARVGPQLDNLGIGVNGTISLTRHLARVGRHRVVAEGRA